METVMMMDYLFFEKDKERSKDKERPDKDKKDKKEKKEKKDKAPKSVEKSGSSAAIKKDLLDKPGESSKQANQARSALVFPGGCRVLRLSSVFVFASFWFFS